VSTLPDELLPKNISTKTIGNCLHFFSASTALSNHSPTPFQVNQTDYHCMEQYWMAKKAEYFDDKDTHDRIMTMENPVMIKRAGKRINKLDNVKWRANATPLLLKGLKAKFTQSKWAKETLLATGQLELVETTDHCNYWANGLAMASERLDQRPWPGANNMGEMLMTVRNEIRRDDRNAGIPPPPILTNQYMPRNAGTLPTLNPGQHAIYQPPPVPLQMQAMERDLIDLGETNTPNQDMPLHPTGVQLAMMAMANPPLYIDQENNTAANQEPINPMDTDNNDSEVEEGEITTL
jgi:ribA/ribD-fused uncharacterized protein